jgi:hypothetical protein
LGRKKEFRQLYSQKNIIQAENNDEVVLTQEKLSEWIIGSSRKKGRVPLMRVPKSKLPRCVVYIRTDRIMRKMSSKRVRRYQSPQITFILRTSISKKGEILKRFDKDSCERHNSNSLT